MRLTFFIPFDIALILNTQTQTLVIRKGLNHTSSNNYQKQADKWLYIFIFTDGLFFQVTSIKS